LKTPITILLSIIIVTLSGCSAPTCSDFKTGKFVHQGDDDQLIVITRTDDKQIEVSEKEGFVDEYAVTWVNECEYQLVLTSTNKPFDSLTLFEDTMTVRLNTTTENGYSYVAFFKDKKFDGILNRLEN
jgi:hypothetical protein